MIVLDDIRKLPPEERIILLREIEEKISDRNSPLAEEICSLIDETERELLILSRTKTETIDTIIQSPKKAEEEIPKKEQSIETVVGLENVEETGRKNDEGLRSEYHHNDTRTIEPESTHKAYSTKKEEIYGRKQEEIYGKKVEDAYERSQREKNRNTEQDMYNHLERPGESKIRQKSRIEKNREDDKRKYQRN